MEAGTVGGKAVVLTARPQDHNEMMIMTSERILFIQSGGPGVHDEWDNRLVDSLEQEEVISAIGD